MNLSYSLFARMSLGHGLLNMALVFFMKYCDSQIVLVLNSLVPVTVFRMQSAMKQMTSGVHFWSENLASLVLRTSKSN